MWQLHFPISLNVLWFLLLQSGILDNTLQQIWIPIDPALLELGGSGLLTWLDYFSKVYFSGNIISDIAIYRV